MPNMETGRWFVRGSKNLTNVRIDFYFSGIAIGNLAINQDYLLFCNYPAQKIMQWPRSDNFTIALCWG